MTIPKHLSTFFTDSLIKWNHNENVREMPWKGEKNGYKVWLSEVILQQTRVEQGMPYYQRFVEVYPDVVALANADDNAVFKLWEGLGYYSRCRNLLETARKIRDQHNGIFPHEYVEIRKLKGVGDYTAAAVASFAFNLPYAVVDGNVLRVLSRFFAIDTEVTSTTGKILFADIAHQLLDKTNPAQYNQAIMDLGATICKPNQPLCEICPLNSKCKAFRLGMIDKLPVKKKAAEKKRRFFYYFLMHFDDHIYVRKRIEKDIWQNLYEFVLWETDQKQDDPEIFRNGFLKKYFSKNESQMVEISPEQKQVLSHQVLSARFIRVNLRSPLKHEKEYELISTKRLSVLPFPKLITAYLKDKNVSLNLQ